MDQEKYITLLAYVQDVSDLHKARARPNRIVMTRLCGRITFSFPGL